MENDMGKLACRVLLGLAVVAFLCSLYPAFYLAGFVSGLLGVQMLGELLVFAYAFGIFFVALVPFWRKCAGLTAEDLR
jgi:hypothetical protein